MKALTFKRTTATIILVFLATGLYAAEVSKQIVKSFTLNSTTEVTIDNKFGNIIINRWDKTTFDMKVIITASNNKSESAAKEMLDDIGIKITDKISSGRLEIESVIPESRNNKNSYRINYEISMPGNVPLLLNNSFGNIVMGSHTGPLDITVKFGQLIAEDLENAKIRVEFSNAKCEIESLNSGSIDLRFGKMMLGAVGNVQIQSQHSEMEIGAVGNATLDGRHGNFSFSTVKSLRGTLEFAGLKIEKLDDVISIVSKHGDGLSISEVAPNFKEITMESQFSAIDIRMLSGTQARLNFHLEFGNLKANGQGINFSKVIKENTSSQYEGYLGKSTAPGVIKLAAKYGNIRFDVN